MKQEKIVKITWRDASSKTGWTEKEEAMEWIDEDFPYYAVGMLLKKDKRFISVATSWEEEQYLNIQKIPIGCVIKIEKLK